MCGLVEGDFILFYSFLQSTFMKLPCHVHAGVNWFLYPSETSIDWGWTGILGLVSFRYIMEDYKEKFERMIIFQFILCFYKSVVYRSPHLYEI